MARSARRGTESPARCVPARSRPHVSLSARSRGAGLPDARQQQDQVRGRVRDSGLANVLEDERPASRLANTRPRRTELTLGYSCHWLKTTPTRRSGGMLARDSWTAPKLEALSRTTSRVPSVTAGSHRASGLLANAAPSTMIHSNCQRRISNNWGRGVKSKLRLGCEPPRAMQFQR